MTSDPGDLVGAGIPVEIDSASHGFAENGAVTTAGIRFSVEGTSPVYGNQNASLAFSPPPGQVFEQGEYADAETPAPVGAAVAGIQVSAEDGCGFPSGSFDIRDIATDGTTITRLDLMFVQHCGGAQPALFGELRIGEPYSAGTVVSSQSIDWPTLYTGVAGTPVAVIVRNDAPDPRQLTAAVISADTTDFHIIGDDCPGKALAAGGSCTVSVGFCPSAAAGLRSSALSLAFAAKPGTAAAVDTIPLHGAVYAGATSLTLSGSGGLSVYAQPTVLTPAHDEFDIIGQTTLLALEVVQPGGLPIFVTLAAPAGGTLKTGFHPVAPRYPFNGSAAGLTVQIDAEGCSSSTGSFRITQAVYDPVSGQLLHFAATFTQQCGGSPTGDPLEGALDYRTGPNLALGIRPGPRIPLLPARLR